MSASANQNNGGGFLSRSRLARRLAVRAGADRRHTSCHQHPGTGRDPISSVTANCPATDVNHPKNNGMIEYFVTRMAGMRSTATFDELVAYRSQRGMGYRTRPPGVVDGPIGTGVLDLPHACARAKRLTKLPFKFTLTGPHMLAKTLINKHYKSGPDLAMALAAALAEQGQVHRR